MELLDEQGRLFGLVNVIDLAVALLVVSSLSAGAAFVLAGDPISPPTEDRYLTVVLEERPAGSLPTLDGDGTTTPSGSVTVGRTDGRVTDTYVAPTGEDGFVTVARIRVRVSPAAANRTTDRKLVTDGRNYSVGQRVGLGADDATYRGYVHAVGTSGADLPVRTANATVVSTLPSSVAERLETGDSQRIAGTEVARITTVRRAATGDTRTRVEVTVELSVYEPDGAPLYGSQHVRPGADVTIASDGYEFTGTVIEVR